jgi:glycosyltransferase involved in cell wall biosynthesis
MTSYSVIIPVYNRSEKLMRAIRSVMNLARGLEDKVEIVVVDDASTDGSADTARSAGADRVLVLEKNIGVTGARNWGIKDALGEILIFLDSDDELTVDALFKIGAHFSENHRTDILFGACVDRAGKTMHRSHAKLGLVSYEHFLANSAPGEFLPVVRRRVFEGLMFETELRGFEGITWLKAARMGYGLHYSPEVLRVYDKEGEDRLCRRHNIVRGADRLARGWQRFLTLFGSDLWSLKKIAYLRIVFRWAVYSRIASVTPSSSEVSPAIGVGLRQILTHGVAGVCSAVPRAIWVSILNSR